MLLVYILYTFAIHQNIKKMSDRKIILKPTGVLSVRIPIDLKKKLKKLTPEQNDGLHNKVRKLVEKATLEIQ